MWGDGLLDGSDLLHHRLVNGQPARSIHNNCTESFEFGLFNGSLGDFYRIHVPLFGVDRYTNLFANHLELVDGCRTIDVIRYKQWLFPIFGLQEIGQFPGKGGLT